MASGATQGSILNSILLLANRGIVTYDQINYVLQGVNE